MNDKTYDPISVDTYAAPTEGIHKPPGLSLETVAEEKSFEIATETRFQELSQVLIKIEAKLDELLEWKNVFIESQHLDKVTSRIIENSEPPLIPSLPNQLSNASSSNSVRSTPLVNDVRNLTDKVTTANFNFVTEKQPLLSNGFTTMPKLPDTQRNDFSVYTTASSVHDDSISQTTTHSSFDFTNHESSSAQKVPTSFNFSGKSASVPTTFQFENRKWEPTARRQFEESVKNTANDFINRVEARTGSNVEVPLRRPLPDSNPFKVDLDKNYYYPDSQGAAAPPPLPPRRSEKPWDCLMTSDVQNQKNSPGTRMVYEAPPILYNVPSKATSNTNNLNAASIQREENYNFPLKKSQHEIYGETLEQRNLRLFTESTSNLTSQSSIGVETTITGDSTNSKTKIPDSPPLPPRPFSFDFNKLSPDEQDHYTDSDDSINDTNLAIRNRKTRIKNARRPITGRKPVALALKRHEKPNESINQNGNIGREINADCGLDTADPCRFKPYQISENRTVYIFDMDNEGWLATEEFAATFTNMHAMTMVNLLKALGVIVHYKTLSRIDNQQFFEKLERSSVAVSRDVYKKINILHLTPLKCVIKILRKLKFVTQEEIELIKDKLLPNKSQMLHQVVQLIQDYAKFQQLIHPPSENISPV